MEAAYKSGETWLNEVLLYLERNVELVRTRLKNVPGARLIDPEGTFLLWLDFRSLGLQPDNLTAFLRGKANLALTRGPAFGPEGSGFARFNIACTRARLEAALDNLANAIASG